MQRLTEALKEFAYDMLYGVGCIIELLIDCAIGIWEDCVRKG
ncbi:hypothetical protein [Xanthomonas phage X1]|nr:hypothetical protein [Xanthomonas phage X1]